MSINRYVPTGSHGRMRECVQGGDWIRYTDHLSELKKERAEIAMLTTQNGLLQEERDSAYVKLRCVSAENAALIADGRKQFRRFIE